MASSFWPSFSLLGDGLPAERDPARDLQARPVESFVEDHGFNRTGDFLRLDEPADVDVLQDGRKRILVHALDQRGPDIPRRDADDADAPDTLKVEFAAQNAWPERHCGF